MITKVLNGRRATRRGSDSPYICICEKKKFVKKKTHFDTNHCTTVLWSKDDNDNEGFSQELVATVRRSHDESV